MGNGVVGFNNHIKFIKSLRDLLIYWVDCSKNRLIKVKTEFKNIVDIQIKLTQSSFSEWIHKEWKGKGMHLLSQCGALSQQLVRQ